MAGPLTPPPSSATEMADEARTAAPALPAEPIPAATPAPPAAPIDSKQGLQDPYQQIFPTIVNLAQQRDYRQLISVAERYDLNGEGDRQPSRLLLVAPLILSYLILDDLPPAHHVLTRLPDRITAIPLSQALFSVLSSTWERHHEQVYSRSESLYKYTQQPDFPDPKLGELVASMLLIFVDAFRERTVKLLSRGYTTLSLALAQKYIGLPIQQIVPAAEKAGWTYDSSNQTLKPAPPAQATVAPANVDGPSSLFTFNLVANSTALLEM